MAQHPGAPAAGPARDTARRLAILGGFAGFVAAGVAMRLPRGGLVIVAVAVAAVAAAGVAVRADPPWGLAASAVATAAVVVIGNGTTNNVGWFGLAILAFWATLAGPRRDGLLYWTAALVIFAVEAGAVKADPGWAPWAGGTTFAAIGGMMTRRQLDLVGALRAAQAELAERSRTEERTRIAQEIHDIIAHSLTVSLLHVASARLALAEDPASAGRELAEAERLSRQSLVEVRNTVGLLRRDELADSTAPPLPGLADVGILVERLRVAGATVDLSVDGDPAGAPATTGLAAYRIIQEALTNAAKHAAGEPVRVAVRVTDRVVAISVDSATPPGSQAVLPGHPGSGLGLGGMRERAEALGGTCHAGPGGAGWLVCATLPGRGER